MSHLTLVRHGQANSFEADYDRLSPAGEAQARALGIFWAARAVVFDTVYSGPRTRQKETVRIVGERYANAGPRWPEVRILPDLDEYDAHSILSHFSPQLEAEDPEFRGLREAYQAAGEDLERNRRFQRMFERVMRHWTRTSQETTGLESWSGFRERVKRGLATIMDGAGSGRSIVAFTSGGPIGVAVQLSLSAPDIAALELNWRVRNCSLTEFVFTGSRFSLDSFNALPHLGDQSLWTYR